VTPPALTAVKRVVLHHTAGQYAGLWQIVGTTKSLPTQAAHLFPEFLPKLRFIDHMGAASLVAVRERYLLYREVTEPRKGKLNDFHPKQA
jgi:hypothetical protein